MIKKILCKAGATCGAVLCLSLAMLAGNGGDIPAWVAWYLFVLAYVAVVGLYVAVRYRVRID